MSVGFSFWERSHFRLFGSWPQSVVRRRLLYDKLAERQARGRYGARVKP